MILKPTTEDCAPGEFLSGNLCLPCPEGSKCVNGERDPCGSGEFSGIGASDCSSCALLGGLLIELGFIKYKMVGKKDHTGAGIV